MTVISCPTFVPGDLRAMRAEGCPTCGHRVFDLSAMTKAQAHALLDATTERICVFLRLRPDGRAIFRSVGVALSIASGGCALAPDELDAPQAPTVHEPVAGEYEWATRVDPQRGADGPESVSDAPTDGPPEEAPVLVPPSIVSDDSCCVEPEPGIGLGCMGVVYRPCKPIPSPGEAAAAAVAAAKQATQAPQMETQKRQRRRRP